MQHLPVHPFMRHPHTGNPLRAVGILDSGRVVWPIIGASPDDDPAAVAAAAAAKAVADKAAADAAAAAEKQETGFPANTPVAEMTATQQTAYWKHQAKKHEGRNSELMQLTGGKFGDALKAELAELDKLRTAQMSDADKAIVAAKNEGRTDAIQTAATSAARVALEFALGHDPDKNDQTALIDTLDMSKLVNTDGSVAADKVRALVATIAPSVKGKGTSRHDFGAGDRTTQPSGKAGQSGAAEAERRFGKKSGE